MTRYKFCPSCGGNLTTKMREHRQRLVCNKCDGILYINSKPCVAVLVEKEGRLMLTRRGIEPFRGWWDLPGGFLEDGEHPQEGARREIREETGLEVQITRLMGIHMDTYGDTGVSTLNFHYLAEAIGGSESPKSDVDMIRWFLPGELPREMAFENCRIAVDRWKNLKLTNQIAGVM